MSAVALVSTTGCFPPLPAADEDVDAADTIELDSTHSDTAVEDTAMTVDTAVADSGAEDATQLDTVQPDTVQPDTVQPDTVQPDTVQPDTSQPDTSQPDTAQAQDTNEPQDTVTSPDTVEPADTVEPEDTVQAEDTVQPQDTAQPGDTVQPQDTTVVLTCPGGCQASTTPCKVAQCDTSTGACVLVNAQNGSGCDDGLVCTISDKCFDGQCLSAQNPCDDGIGCTIDSCDEGLGGCLHDAVTACECGPGRPCSDGNACNGVETCDLSSYSCQSGTPPAEHAPCDDGLVCTVDDGCHGGVCSGATRDCADALACSVDGCSEALGGCVNDTAGCLCTSDAQCPDTNLCDGTSYCDFDANGCAPGTPVTCDEPANACQRVVCVPATGACAVVDREDGTPCDDVNVCTTTDTCQEGTCTGFAPITCTPSNTCQQSLGCDPTHGCLEIPREDGTPCQTTSDAQGSCKSGACKRLPIVVASDHHTCVVTSGRSLKCWGRNVTGELGTGDWSFQWPPADVPAVLHGVVAIAAHHNNTCAVTEDGLTRCWGENPIGNLGYGDLLDRGATPETVPALLPGVPTGAIATDVDMVEGHICVMTAAKNVRCWGSGSGYPGVSLVGAPNTPTPAELGDLDIDSTSHVASIAVAACGTCARLDSGDLRCWGHPSCNGSVNQTTIGDDEAPSAAPAINDGWTALAVSGGANHVCAVSTAGQIYCWGSNDSHQLGIAADTSTTDHWQPTLIASPTQFHDIVAAEDFTCGITDGGGVRCWGANDHGQCGVGTNLQVAAVPSTDVPLGGQVAQLSCGTTHCCAMMESGDVRCWGSNEDGRLGLSIPSPIDGHPVPKYGNIGDEPGEMPPPVLIFE